MIVEVKFSKTRVHCQLRLCDPIIFQSQSLEYHKLTERSKSNSRVHQPQSYQSHDDSRVRDI